jgi:hypothetical protein
VLNTITHFELCNPRHANPQPRRDRFRRCISTGFVENADNASKVLQRKTLKVAAKAKEGAEGCKAKVRSKHKRPQNTLAMADLLPRHPKRWGGHQPVGKAPATNPPIPTQLVQVTSGSACCKPHNPVFVAVRYGTQELVFDDEGNEVQLTDRFRHPINKPTVVTCQVPLPGVVHMPELVALPSPVCLAPP